MHATRPVLAAAAAAVAAVTLAACSAGEAAETAPPATSAASEAAAEVTIETATGEQTVATNPTSVVVFDFGVLDTLDTLGLGDVVSGVPNQAVPSYLAGYTETGENVGTLFEPDFEAVNALEPDLIIVGGRSASQAEALAEIAPTIDLTLESGSEQFLESLERNTLAIGQIFNVETEAQAALDELTAKADAIAADAADAGTGLVIITTGGQLSAYGPSEGGRYDFVYGVLGIEPASDQGTIDTHGDSISYEFLADVDPALLIVIDRDAAIGAEGESAQQLMDNDLVNGTTAAADDAISYVDPSPWYLAFGGLTAVNAVYDDVAALVG